MSIWAWLSIKNLCPNLELAYVPRRLLAIETNNLCEKIIGKTPSKIKSVKKTVVHVAFSQWKLLLLNMSVSGETNYVFNFPCLNDRNLVQS